METLLSSFSSRTQHTLSIIWKSEKSTAAWGVIRPGHEGTVQELKLNMTAVCYGWNS